MVVVLRNLQRVVRFKSQVLHHHAMLLAEIVGIQDYDWAVVCVNKKYIRNLNKIYRNRDSATDVLSFPYYHDITPGKIPKPDAEIGDHNLGDIFLCLSVIRKQSKLEQRDFQYLLPVYLTHGICHILGYSHHTKKCRAKMFAKEAAILSQFGQRIDKDYTGYTPLTDDAG